MIGKFWGKCRFMDVGVLQALEGIVEKSYVLSDRSRIQDYLQDETAEAVRPEPAADVVLVKPANTDELSRLMKYADANKLAVFVRGGGTGLVGGSIPTENGILVSLERMDRVVVDTENLMAVAEAGVTLERLTATVESFGLCFPLHPGDDAAQVGGLLATNAGGANAVRHGVMRNYVRGIEVVLPSGDVMMFGGKLHKDNVGYDLMQLIIGSEGTLAIVTKAILKLYPKCEVTAILIVPFDDRLDAVRTVPNILQSGRAPLGIEYVERDVMETAARELSETWPSRQGSCYLLITLAEASRDQLLSESVRIEEICEKNNCLEILFADTPRERDRIERIRSNLYSVLKASIADILDVTVPPADIGKLIDAVDETAKEYSIRLPVYGHAGDGNLHVHIMRGGRTNEDFVDEVRSRIYDACVKLGGVITGEHGIGKTRIRCIGNYLAADELELMRKIKRTFDPNEILNPGVKIPL
jgi:glycolate oxidase